MKKSFITIIVGVVLVALLAACQGVAPTATTTSTDTTRQISVSGVGKVYIVPDMAYIYIGVHTENKDVSAALTANNQQAQQIADTLTGLGVAKEDIQTSAFNVSPQTNYNADGTKSDTTYSVDNTVYVKITDLQKLGDILNAVVQNGANSINGISFDVADRTTAEEQARKMAIDDAKAKAQDLANLAGVQLGDLITVSTSTPSTPSPVYDARSMVNAAQSSVPVAAGQLVIEIDATMSYAIK